MPYSEQVLRRARDRLEEASRQRRREYENHLEQAYRLRPRLREIDRELRQTMAEAMALCFARGEDPAQAMARIKERNLALQDERQWILDEAELGDDYLDDSPVCAICGGTGYVGAQMCECLSELCRQEQKRELSGLLGTGKERFESFSLSYYPEQYDQDLGASPRQIMGRTLNVCRRYAQSFRPGSGNLLLSGAPGLGKTLLSACIARTVADGGYSVAYASAPKLFSAFERERFGSGGEDLERYTRCDLLMIDDLGAEMTTQFVISTLYTLVNDRLLDHRAMVVSTNLRPEDLDPRYGPQLRSRLLGSFQYVPFVGRDIRQLVEKKG